MRFHLRSLHLLALVTLGGALTSHAAEFHIAPTGHDDANGSATAPFATLTRARDAVRALRQGAAPREAVTVWIHGGAYEMAQPLQLEPQDSGGAKAPVVYRAVAGETPLFLGSRKIDGFIPYQGSILKADVTSLKLEKLHIRQLLFDGKRQPLARYPNVDPQDPLYGGWAFLQDIPPGKDEGHKWKSEAYLAEKDVRHWAHPEDVEIDIFANYGWWNFIVPVKGIDAATRKLTLAKDCGYDLHPYNRYHFQNALEELDAPGEWYLDQRTHTLYFWPPQPLAGHEVRVPVLDAFIRMKAKVHHVSVEGLSFQGCIGTAIALENCDDCAVRRCTVSHCGAFIGAGISVNGTHNLVQENEITYIGSTGVSVNGGDRITLTAAENVVDNNHIHHVGVLNKNGAGIGLNGCGSRITHNLIHDTPRMAIQFGGNNFAIEYNHMHHTVQETQDGGAVYTGGRDWISSRGTVLRYNLIQDTMGVGQEKQGLVHPFFTWGIYMDDNTGGVNIIGNIVARSARASLHLHNARDCIVQNNIFVDGGQKELEYDGWSREQHYVVDHLPTMVAGWSKVKDQPAWQNMRGMKIDPRDSFFPDGTMMSGDDIQHNIVMWHDPSLRYVDFRHISSAHNVSDYNLIWNGGHPIRTAVSKAGPDQGPDLLQGGGLFPPSDEGKTPKGWGWNHRPRPDLKLMVRDGVLEVDAASSADPKASHSVIHGPNVPIQFGSAYRARLEIRAMEPGLQASLSFGVFENGKGYWQTSGQTVPLTTEWKEVEVAGSMPKEGESQWKAWMKTFWLRMDVHGDKGAVQLRHVTLREAAPMNEWTSWQSEGWDRHSVIADPQFIDEAHDDYRLKAESPAWKLGFHKIPVEQIGLYGERWQAAGVK